MDIQYCIKYAALAVALLLTYMVIDTLVLRAVGRMKMDVIATEGLGIVGGSIAWAVYFAL